MRFFAQAFSVNGHFVVCQTCLFFGLKRPLHALVKLTSKGVNLERSGIDTGRCLAIALDLLRHSKATPTGARQVLSISF